MIRKNIFRLCTIITIPLALLDCISTRSGNFPAKIDIQNSPVTQKIALGYTVKLEFESQKSGPVNDVFAKKTGERFEKIAQESNRFEISNVISNQPYVLEVKKEFMEANTGWMIVSTILSGAGLVLPRFAGTSVVNYTFQVNKAGKAIKTYEYKNARTHEFGWTLFLFVMPFTSSGKVHDEMDDLTFKHFIKDAAADQIFR